MPMTDSAAESDLYQLTMHELLAADMANYISTLMTGQWCGPGEFGSPVGVWQSTVGLLNRVFVLHNIEKDSNANLLGENGESSEYHSLVKPVERTVQLLRAVKPVTLPPPSEKLYELRLYTLFPGALSIYLPLLLGALPAREKYSKNVGIWTPVTGPVDTLVHLWAYKDADHRTQLRPSIDADPVWQEFVPKILPLIRGIQTYFLAGLPFRPRPGQDPPKG